MKLQHLSIDHVTSVLYACEAVENAPRAASFGTDIKSSPLFSRSYEVATEHLLNVLTAIPDMAIIELQALVWAGRGNFDGNLSENLDYSRTRFDSTTRDYLASKNQLRESIQYSLHTCNVTLRD